MVGNNFRRAFVGVASKDVENHVRELTERLERLE